jgi:hypothetical protein
MQQILLPKPLFYWNNLRFLPHRKQCIVHRYHKTLIHGYSMKKPGHIQRLPQHDSPLPRSIGARRNRLKATLVLTDQWLRNLTDPELGPIGQSLQQAFAATGAHEHINRKGESALYTSYVYPPNTGQRNFLNRIVYGPALESNPDLLFPIRCQKIAYALQPVCALAMHADPFNAETNIMLSPRDYVIRKERIRQDAYTKAAWLASLAAKDRPGIRAATENDILPVWLFEQLRTEAHTLEETLRRAALAASNHSGFWSHPFFPHRAADDWHAAGLEEYERIIDLRLKRGDTIIFVRMDMRDGENDMLALGGSFGPNPFGKDARLYPEFEQTQFSEENWQRLIALEEKLGIGNNAALPTLREGLSVLSLSPQEFLAQSRRENVLTYIERWTQDLHDPELGPVGQEFNALAAKTGCAEGVDLKTRHNAYQTSYVYPPQQGQTNFPNRISYGDTALKNLPLFFSARNHEFIHVSQYNTAPALHANPFNAATDLVLAPLDYVMVKERMEQDAYAKGAWLCTLGVTAHPTIRKEMDGAILSVTTFETLRAQSASVAETLRKAATAASSSEGYWLSGDNMPKVPVTTNWHELALKEYRSIIQTRLEDCKKSGKTLTFIRLNSTGIGDDNDILPIGVAFGPNSFGENGKIYPEFAARPVLSSGNRALFEALYKDFPIPQDQALKIFGKELAARGETKSSFLTRMRGNDHSPAKPRKTPRALKL